MKGLIRTEAEEWTSIAKCRFDDNAPPSTFPARRLRLVVKAIHRDAGISPDFGERSLLELAEEAADAPLLGAKATEFWQAVHQIGADRAARVLAAAGLGTGIPARTCGGQFKQPGQVFAPGPILRPEEDPVRCVDLEFHNSDGRLLTLIGVVDQPMWHPVDSSNRHLGVLGDYVDECEERWRSQESSAGRGNPQVGMSKLAPRTGPAEFPTHLRVLAECSDGAKQRFSTLVQNRRSWGERWEVRHRTQKKYQMLEVLSPAAWALNKWGRAETSLGLRPFDRLVDRRFEQWAPFLPVAAIGAQTLERVGIAADETSQLDRAWSRAFESAASLADSDETPASVDFLYFAAERGQIPPEGAALPALTDRFEEAAALRADGTRVWLCRPEQLAGWPHGWEFDGIERPPAEPVGDIEISTLEEWFPALAARVAESYSVWECDGVLDNGRAVDAGRRGPAMLVRRGADGADVRRWVARELLPAMSETERAALVADAVSQEIAELISNVRAQPDDESRLQALLGGGLLDAVDALVPWPLEDVERSGPSTLLTLYGPAVLRECRSHLPSGLGVPHQWAGGARTIEFVRSLGFGDSYAGRRTSERPDTEMVLGPTVPGKLHDFQREIAGRVIEILSEHRRGVVDLPTGAGKTRVAIESILDFAHRNGRLGLVLWIAERDELCEQAVTHWTQLWRARGLRDRELVVQRFWGGRQPDEIGTETDGVVVCSRQQLAGRLGTEGVGWMARSGVVVIDEAHHSTARTYREIVDWRAETNNEEFATLGLSATPFRSDAERTAHLARLFDRSLVTGDLMGDKWKKRIKWLQKHEYLSRVDLQDLDLGTVEPNPHEADLLLSQSNLSTGLDQLNERLAEDLERNGAIVNSIRAMNPEWPVVVFAGSVFHAQLLATMLSDLGISARPVWGALSKWARHDAIEQFRSQRIRVLTNYNVLSEGFDAPKTRAVVVARMVQSDGLFLQMLGRGMRGPNNGGTKRCLLVTTGERLPERFDAHGELDVNRHDYLWSPR